ncbi:MULTISPECIES: MarR family winged helix-turn-helix transcriptional regulator [Microbacterium]|uniref:MarR family transcriptional regulator n=1 Tax=Microbacterium aurugineum TaxID=2851642 RepID=A0ABY4J240_9MICO|nr:MULTISPECIES: MarR family transcriptional regulator [Microbacterium]PKQ36247.1 MAG: MarR family transcriptional regulator [Actinobacteria bacterium HGW-Actinobacteria-11]MCK8476060.1 MarR family transcriptional regulator [Microbacterium aurugineum]TCJ22650.1 MarR family transcriptional regulator [Microbacterium sp. PI-1]TFB16701.1 MarR family transcriptional regulator [Microbacterium sp. 3H14]UPL19082.1 MarR family transcriptional regulator [Microbacterium aurugineum]
MSEPQEYTRSGYWYPDGGNVSTVDVLNMLRRYRAAETAMRARTRASMGMNETDLMALRFLLREQRAGRIVRPIDIAKMLDISTASTTTLIDRLEKGGHVRREPHPTDRRAGVVVPTVSSDEEVRATLGAMHRRMLALVDELSDDERAVVTRFLAGMTAAIEEASDLDQELRDAIRDEKDTGPAR